ncbi:hypothetical protein PFICI_06142 [Pestalotiopsis fici W106-1]|uniref:DUF7702 domain-containing protein n=1 Tax=Pestalotiopsis fici (strain W106-1 / CGMCC3.15140) TaxID=1229662 RepID=W3X504_PESFW|nr:uncharacterized protein PFICI_06142 [Pestalotiopsis fici W106-1]ETS81140.1 hypothetical protein PFICI_06142 [Pestalotiopsis fici W106-1]
MADSHATFTFRHGIAAAQLVIFSLSLFSAIFFRYRHRNGWFCIGVFSIFRIVGARCMLGTLTNDATSVWAGVFVCESLGMVLLVFLLLELLQRANKEVETINPRWFWYPQIITWADIGLAVGGFVSASHHSSLAPTPYTQASFGLYTSMYLLVVGMTWFLWRNRASYPIDEKRAILCVVVCLTLLAIRTAYALIYQITGDKTWNAVEGRPTPYLLMTMLPELGIIYVAIWTICQISPPPQEKRGRTRSEELYSFVHGDSGDRLRAHDEENNKPQSAETIHM